MLAEKKIHYGWIVALSGVGVLFSCLGLGRFSLGMILPSMGSSLSLNYSQMGWIGTANFAGYMAGVIAAGKVASRIGARRSIVLGLFLVALSMICISRAQGFMSVTGWYLLTGVGSGLANVPMMGLVSHWFFKSARGKAAGLMLTGNSLGIIFSGLFIPWLNLHEGADGWRDCWFYMGLLALFFAIVSACLIRNSPHDMGMVPAGRPEPPPLAEKKGPSGILNRLGLLYGLFGATHVIYITFIVTMLVNERGFGENSAGLFWVMFGGLSVLSGPVMGSLSDRIGRTKVIALVFVLFASAYLIMALSLPDLFLYCSVVVFGISAWSIPTILSAAVGDYMGPERAARAFGYITVFCGFGQVIGPALAGELADFSGTFRVVFFINTAAALFAAAYSWRLQR